MRTFIATGFVLALVSIATAGGQAKDNKIDVKKLIGKWEPADGKSPIVIEFTDKGKLTLSVDLNGKSEKVDGTYKLTNDKLDMVLMVLGKEVKETITVTKLTDEDFVGKDTSGKEESFKRIKPKK